jgi:hypothetical protein
MSMLFSEGLITPGVLIITHVPYLLLGAFLIFTFIRIKAELLRILSSKKTMERIIKNIKKGEK